MHPAPQEIAASRTLQLTTAGSVISIGAPFTLPLAALPLFTLPVLHVRGCFRHQLAHTSLYSSWNTTLVQYILKRWYVYIHTERSEVTERKQVDGNSGLCGCTNRGLEAVWCVWFDPQPSSTSSASA
jgi:hypothetical protein